MCFHMTQIKNEPKIIIFLQFQGEINKMTHPSPLLLANNISFEVADGICLVLLLFCVLASGFFSSCETTFSGSNMIRMKNYAEEKVKGARRALYIMEHYDKTLSTILVGNNFVNIASTTIAAYLFGKFILDPTLSNVLNTVIMTIIILICGEIIPKSVAKANPEKLALKFSGTLYFLMKVLTPITWFFGLFQKMALKKVKTSDEPTVTEDELESIIENMEEEGVLDENNVNLLQGVLDMGERTVYDIMTPRVDMIAIEKNATIDEVKQVFIDSQFSRIPVFFEDKDNIVGILNQKDFMTKILKNQEINISSIITKPLFVTELLKVDDLIRKMQSEKKHLAIVLDEHGGTSGLVTMEDALEEMVGEIYDEHDEEEAAPIKKNGDNSYIIDPDVTIEALFDFLQIEHLPESDYSSVGGMLYQMSDSLPEKGQEFEISAVDDILDENNNYIQKVANLKFTITAVEDRRIKSVNLSVSREEKIEE